MTSGKGVSSAMARYLLDTNHLSPLVTLDHALRDRLIHQLRLGDTFAVPVPALTEALYGILLLPRVRQSLHEWQRYSAYFNYYWVERDDAERAAHLQVDLRRRGRQLGTVDALIATVALRYDLTLLTTDKDFLAIPSLTCENWLTGA